MIERSNEESRVFRTVSVAKMVDEIERRVSTQIENMEQRLSRRFERMVKGVIGNGGGEEVPTPPQLVSEAEEMGRIIGETMINNAEEQLAKRHSQDCKDLPTHLIAILTPSLNHTKRDLQTAKKAREAHEEQAEEAMSQARSARGSRIAHESILQELNSLPHPERYHHRHRIESCNQQLAHWQEEEENNEAWVREHEISVEEEKGRVQRAKGKCAVLEEKLEELRAKGLIDWRS